MRIGLFGIYGVYNFGCEAIVRGTYRFLQNIYQGCEIVYYSRNYKYDKRVLSNLNIEVKKITPKFAIPRKIANKILHVINADMRFLPFNYNALIKDVDMFYFIGGDIFTIPEIARKKRKYYYANELIEFGKMAGKHNVPIVLYGASVGPFGKYKKAVNYYKTNLSAYKCILCREYDSVNYLQDIGLKNVAFSQDPAFLVQSEKSLKIEKKYIGINLSPLSLREIYGEYGEQHINAFVQMIERIQQRYKKDILLIPHVVTPDIGDDDLQFQKIILSRLESKCKTHVTIADCQDGFLEIKEQLKECYVVVTARMHCAINAIHENVPTILLSYSQKSIGMCKYVYGDDFWAIKLNAINEELEGKLDFMMSNLDVITQQLVMRNRKIQEDYQRQIDGLSHLLH